MIVQFYRIFGQKKILMKELNINILPPKGTIIKHFCRSFKVTDIFFDLETCKYNINMTEI